VPLYAKEDLCIPGPAHTRTFSYRKKQNAFVESFNGKFRKECLDLNCLGKIYLKQEM